MKDIKKRISELSVLSVGHTTHDRYGENIIPGGCAFFGAIVAFELGAEVKFLTRTGDDFLCDDYLSRMKIHNIKQGKTTVFTNIYPEGGMRIQTVESQAPPLTVHDLPESFRLVDLLFIAPVMGEINPVEPWSKYIQSDFTVLALQGFMKKGENKAGKRLVIKKEDPLPVEMFNQIDAVFLSEEDIALFGEPDLLEKLKKNVKYVFVTDGENGSTAYFNGKSFHFGVYETKAEDPTGAGDTYAMATSLALSSGLDLLSSMAFGAAAASITVEKIGSEGVLNLQNTYGRYIELVEKFLKPSD